MVSNIGNGPWSKGVKLSLQYCGLSEAPTHPQLSAITLALSCAAASRRL